MSKRTEEQIRLFKQFGGDGKQLLKEHPSLENLKVFSDRREGLLEWFDFRKGASLLSIGAGSGALIPMYLRKGLSVTVADVEEGALHLASLRAEASETGGSARVHLLRLPAIGKEEDAAPEAEDLSSAERLVSALNREPELKTLFDYIVLDGMPDFRGKALADWAKEHLSEAGTLFLAADNAYGIRAFSGVETEEGALSPEQLEAMLGGDGNIQRYYAEPMGALPDLIYSERRLPREGELSRVIPAYGFPACLAVDPGEKYDAVCRDGLFPRFADSFLYLWSRNQGAPTPVFVKYNRNRRPCYQLKTVIRETEDGYQVEKEALKEEGRDHIQAFRTRFDILCGEQSGIRYAAPVLSPDGRKVSFPWIEGRTLTELILEEIRNGREVREVLEEGIQRLVGRGEIHNLDSIFDNFLVEEESRGTKNRIADAVLTGIDYEWVTETPADAGFVTYRILILFYEQQKGTLALGKRDDFLLLFGIDEEERVRFEAMEREFQQMVSGDEQSVFLDPFLAEVKDPKGGEHMERELSTARQDLERFAAKLRGRDAAIREKDAVIRKQTEIKRLTDNHVRNLEVMIENLRRENGALGETLQYLSRHQTLYARLRRKAGDAFNRRYPKGSLERKKLAYQKNALLHPLRTRRMRSTEEGRNLMEGDFAIGDSYRIHGKLHFPAVEEPTVSIVIPCYNQLSYTYACLVSILEHTKQISYEVIIADDVSTDETRHLEHFAEGLVISRNCVNQGFLRNCNQAAKKARGQYIFFLNNDTTVTEGWLDWLLTLMDSDPRIGMTGSKLIYPDGRLQEAGGIIWSDASGWNYGRLEDPNRPEFNYVKDVDYISGAAILIRRSLWEEIGGFDERYAPAYCEDSDLAFEVRKHGYRVVYQPKSVVVHFEGISNGTDVQGRGLKRYQLENTEKLKEKWKTELAQQFENSGNPDPFRARERSGGKKILLVVDHYVPTFDRDAGSRTTWQYLQMLVKQGFQVKFLGDNFACEEPYTSALQQLGIEVLYGPDMQVEIWQWIERHQKDLHLVYLNRPHIASKYIDFIQSRTDLKVLYYGHDLHFLREKREYELTGDPEKLERSEYWKGVELSLLHKADMSFYPSEVECREIHRLDPSIRVKALTAYLWDEFSQDIDRDYEKREGFLFVGGFAHPPNADGVLWFLDEIWGTVNHDRTKNFYVVGSRVPEEILARRDPEAGIHILGFVSDEALQQLYRRCRVVVAPLRYGAGVKGKVIEALYYGAAVLTTSVGAEGIPDAETVLKIADDAADFAEAARALHDDPARLKQMSEAASRYIRAHNSMEAAWETVKEAFLSSR